MTAPHQEKVILRPCPFCGGGVVFDRETSFNRSQIICRDEGIPCGRKFPFVDVEDWNRRPLEDELRAKVERLENQLHKARLLWCDSKRDPETGAVHISHLDKFEAAIADARGGNAV